MNETLKTVIKRALRRMGVRVLREAFLPRGLDFCVDLRDLNGFAPVAMIVDVGANIGQSAERFLAEFPESLVICCEPAPGSFAQLRARLSCNRRVILEPVAVGAVAGVASLRVVGEVSELNHIVAGDIQDRQDVTAVPIVTLDELLDRHKVVTVDILKIDTEGYEMEVLSGAERSLCSGRVRAVYAECSFSSVDAQHTYFPALFSRLTDHRFEFLGLYEVHHHRTGLHYCNALFVRRS